jgi:hypothetical protein
MNVDDIHPDVFDAPVVDVVTLAALYGEVNLRPRRTRLETERARTAACTGRRRGLVGQSRSTPA